MALMLGSLYTALRSANVPDAEAQKAAEEAAGYENRLAGIESRVSTLTWMVGVVGAMQVAILVRLFTH
jgi:hypothetical protein